MCKATRATQRSPKIPSSVRRKIHMTESTTDTIPKNVLTGLLVIPLVLMGLGDLRNVVTPSGYWALWGAWGVAAALLLSPWRSPANWRKPPRLVLLSYAALLAGMIVSGLINQDKATIYQAAKIVVICGLFLAMWLVAVRVKPAQVLTAMYLAVTVSILCFFVPGQPAGQHICLVRCDVEGGHVLSPGIRRRPDRASQGMDPEQLGDRRMFVPGSAGRQPYRATADHHHVRL
jgi:hypothetical protein